MQCCPKLNNTGVAWSTYLTVYESIKGFHLKQQGGDRLSAHWHTISAAEAGALVSCVCFVCVCRHLSSAYA